MHAIFMLWSGMPPHWKKTCTTRETADLQGQKHGRNHVFQDPSIELIKGGQYIFSCPQKFAILIGIQEVITLSNHTNNLSEGRF